MKQAATALAIQVPALLFAIVGVVYWVIASFILVFTAVGACPVFLRGTCMAVGPLMSAFLLWLAACALFALIAWPILWSARRLNT